jgi:transcription-repair coupling factor (superfamily II helicase)
MILNLVADENSPYYSSSAFDKLLWFVQAHARQCRLRETGKKRSVVIRDINTVETAVAALEEMIGAAVPA